MLELHELSRFTITGRGLVIVVDPIENRKSLRGQHVSIDGVPYLVLAVESCLIPGHDEGECPLATGLLVEPVLDTPGKS